MIDEGNPMLRVETMAYAASDKQEHLPGAVQFLFQVPRMASWDVKEIGGKSEADLAPLPGADFPLEAVK